jgi:hypothetical protein
MWRVTQRKLKLLDAAGRLDDLLIPAGNRLGGGTLVRRGHSDLFPGGAWKRRRVVERWDDLVAYRHETSGAGRNPSSA